MDKAVSYGSTIRIDRVNRMRRIELIRLMAPYLIALAAIAFSLFLYLWTRVSVTTLNYEISYLKEQERTLARNNSELKIELDTVTSPASLERMGKERFSLTYPDDSSVIIVR
jgi:cell division protein FtsL